LEGRSTSEFSHQAALSSSLFYVPLEQTVDYQHTLMKRLETHSHFVRGLLLVTNTQLGTLEPQAASISPTNALRRISWRHLVGHACRAAACSSAPSP
jgi:hypothetical protein